MSFLASCNSLYRVPLERKGAQKGERGKKRNSRFVATILPSGATMKSYGRKGYEKREKKKGEGGKRFEYRRISRISPFSSEAPSTCRRNIEERKEVGKKGRGKKEKSIVILRNFCSCIFHHQKGRLGKKRRGKGDIEAVF